MGVQHQHPQPEEHHLGPQANADEHEATHSQILERTGILNVSKSSLQILQLHIDLLNRLLSLGDSGRLKRLNSLDVCVHIICDRLEIFEELGGLVDDGFVFEDGTVVLKVHRGGLGSVLGLNTLGLAVTFAEGLEGRNGLCATKQVSNDLKTVLSDCEPLPRPSVE